MRNLKTDLMTPRQIAVAVLADVADRAFWHGEHVRNRVSPSRRKEPFALGRPGEFFEGLPEEEKEALRHLKSEDLATLRVDPLWCF